MKKIILAAVIAVVVAFTVVQPASAAQRVRGYTRSNGTYVNSYYRTTPNSNRYDNYSTKGNYNPYTGKTGTKSYYNSYRY